MIWLKHQIFEVCIDTIFSGIYKNFVLPKIIPQISISIGDRTVTISDGKHSMSEEIGVVASTGDGGAAELVLKFLKVYHPKVHEKIKELI